MMMPEYPTNPSFPFLKGDKRVAYKELEFVEDSMYPDEGDYYDQGAPYSGIAWSEYAGEIQEDTLDDGVKNGRCVRIHPNGQLASDGMYKDDYPDGELNVWYESGVLKEYYNYSNDRCEVYREFSDNGQMISEQINSPEYLRRNWTREGYLYFEAGDEYSDYLCPDGDWVIRKYFYKHDQKTKPTEYRDEKIYQYAQEMLNADAPLMEHEFFIWLRSQLNKKEKGSMELLFSLFKHPHPEIIEEAMNVVVERRLVDAVPLLRPLLKSRLRKRQSAGGYPGSVGEIAEISIAKLTGRGDVKQIMAHQYMHQKTEKKREERRRNKIKRKWPEVKGVFVETLVLRGTVKTGADLFGGHEKIVQHEYWHYYEYRVDNRTYKACLSTSEETPKSEVMVRYRVKNPGDYYLDEQK